MNNLSLKPVLFLVVGVLIAVGALLQALHDEAYAIPECAVVCVCTNPPCGGPATDPDQPCGGTVCGGGGIAHNCEDYCPLT